VCRAIASCSCGVIVCAKSARGGNSRNKNNLSLTV